MKVKLLFLFFVFIISGVRAQQYVIGKVSGESIEELAGVSVFNVRTEEKVYTNIHGIFMIRALLTDELRFTKKNYERFSIRITQKELTKSVEIVLKSATSEIAEVEIKFKPTGNIKKDSKALDESPRVVALNTNMSSYMKTPLNEPEPKATIPSSFAPPNFSTGQVDIFKVLGAAVGLARKTTNPKKEPNYIETQAFYREIKEKIDLSYYREIGLSEFQLEEFIVYADKRHQLAKNFRTNFDVAAISNYLREAFGEYQKALKINS